MDYCIAVVVPRYVLDLCSARQAPSSSQNNLIMMSEREVVNLLHALHYAPDSQIHIWTQSSSQNKKRNSRDQNVWGMQQVEDWKKDDDNARKQDDQLPAGLSVYDVLRSLSYKNYVGSFFGTTGRDKGALFHQFRKVDIGGHTTNSKLRFYIKFIAPKGIIDESEFYDIYKDQTITGEPLSIDESDVKEGGSKWEVVSFHNNAPLPKNSTSN